MAQVLSNRVTESRLAEANWSRLAEWIDSSRFKSVDCYAIGKKRAIWKFQAGIQLNPIQAHKGYGNLFEFKAIDNWISLNRKVKKFIESEIFRWNFILKFMNYFSLSNIEFWSFFWREKKGDLHTNFSRIFLFNKYWNPIEFSI